MTMEPVGSESLPMAKPTARSPSNPFLSPLDSGQLKQDFPCYGNNRPLVIFSEIFISLFPKDNPMVQPDVYRMRFPLEVADCNR